MHKVRAFDVVLWSGPGPNDSEVTMIDMNEWIILFAKVNTRNGNLALEIVPIFGCEHFWGDSRTFLKWKIAQPWWDSNPRYLDYMPSWLETYVITTTKHSTTK